MIDKRLFDQRLNTEFTGRNALIFEKTGSTNDILRRYYQTLPNGTAAMTDFQTGGRGRRGHSWAAGEHVSLALSVLFKGLNAESARLFTLASALAVSDALNSLYDGGFFIKWPNDIVFCKNNVVKKVCGILCESVVTGGQFALIAGIGVNLLQDAAFFERHQLPYAASIRSLTGITPSFEETAAMICNCLEICYNMLQDGKREQLLLEYRRNCITLGRAVRVLKDGEPAEGTASDIGEDGALIVESAGRLLRLYESEVSVRGVYGYI